MAAPSVPRLLARPGRLWRRARPPGRPAATRSASTTGKAPSPAVLEKPAKFNPPSHGRRLPQRSNPPRHYGGDVTATEAAAQKVRDYPGLMAPAGSWAHWFLHSRGLHTFLTLGMLTSLAAYTFVENFKRTSPFADLVPGVGDFATHPLQSAKLLIEVFRLSTAHKSREVAEKRTRAVDDVEKRRMYRRAHGMDTHTGIAAWLGWNDKDEPEAAAADDGAAGSPDRAEGETPNLAEDMRKRKKFLGIF